MKHSEHFFLAGIFFFFSALFFQLRSETISLILINVGLVALALGLLLDALEQSWQEKSREHTSSSKVVYLPRASTAKTGSPDRPNQPRAQS